MTLEEMKAKAGQIQKDIDAIIDGIDASEIKDAVNWADLSCTDVSVSLTDGTWCATVEEASPDATNLAVYIHRELQHFGHDVWVRCEW
ncbi:hypothetical protein [Bradyrhizobium sp. JR3.5]